MWYDDKSWERRERAMFGMGQWYANVQPPSGPAPGPAPEPMVVGGYKQKYEPSKWVQPGFIGVRQMTARAMTPLPLSPFKPPRREYVTRDPLRTQTRTTEVPWGQRAVEATIWEIRYAKKFWEKQKENVTKELLSQVKYKNYLEGKGKFEFPKPGELDYPTKERGRSLVHGRANEIRKAVDKIARISSDIYEYDKKAGMLDSMLKKATQEQRGSAMFGMGAPPHHHHPGPGPFPGPFPLHYGVTGRDVWDFYPRVILPVDVLYDAGASADKNEPARQRLIQEAQKRLESAAAIKEIRSILSRPELALEVAAEARDLLPFSDAKKISIELIIAAKAGQFNASSKTAIIAKGVYDYSRKHGMSVSEYADELTYVSSGQGTPSLIRSRPSWRGW